MYTYIHIFQYIVHLDLNHREANSSGGKADRWDLSPGSVSY